MMSSNVLPCSFAGCNQFFRTAERFLLHSRRHVNFDFKGESEFESVLAVHQGIYYCSLCGFDSRSAILFAEHLRQHVFSTPYKCSHCNVAVRTILDFKLHFQKDHVELQTTFEFHKNKKVINLLMKVMQLDSENVYFLKSLEGQVVFMKSDTSFWFAITFMSLDRADVDEICLSKNMFEIVEKDLLSEFPGGHTVSNGEIFASPNIKTNIEDNSLMILNSLKNHADPQNTRQVGQYRFSGSEFQCLSCKFVTGSTDMFGDHIWGEVHDENVGCLHRKVQSCIFEGQQICALIESCLYCLVHVFADEMTEPKPKIKEVSQKFEKKNVVETMDCTNVEEALETHKPISCKQEKRQKQKDTREMENSKALNEEKNSKKSIADKRLDKSTSCTAIKSASEKESTSKVESIPNKVQNVSYFQKKSEVSRTNASSKLPSSSKTTNGGQFSKFPFGQYLREYPKKKNYVELIQDFSPFQFVCKKCDFSCNTIKLYQFHKEGCMRPRTSSPGYSCPWCSISCWSKSSLLEHVQFHLGSTMLNIYTCCYCSKYLTNLNHVQCHLKERHSVERMVHSSALKFTSKNISSLRDIVKCFICGSGHTWPSKYIGHLRSKHQMLKLASYLSKKFPEEHVGNKLPVINFPEPLLFCKEEAQIEPDHWGDRSFERMVKRDLDLVDRQEHNIAKSLEKTRQKSKDEKQRHSAIVDPKGSSKYLEKCRKDQENCTKSQGKDTRDCTKSTKGQEKGRGVHEKGSNGHAKIQWRP